MTANADENRSAWAEWRDACTVVAAVMAVTMMALMPPLYFSPVVKGAAIKFMAAMELGLNGWQLIVVGFALILSPLVVLWVSDWAAWVRNAIRR